MEHTQARIHIQTHSDGRTDRQMDGQTDGRADTDRQVSLILFYYTKKQWRTEGWGGGGWLVGGGTTPHQPEIPKALQNRAKLNPIVKTVKNC